MIVREIYGFLRLANPFGHPSQVRTQVLVLQTCVDLRVRLARALILREPRFVPLQRRKTQFPSVDSCTFQSTNTKQCAIITIDSFSRSFFFCSLFHSSFSETSLDTKHFQSW